MNQSKKKGGNSKNNIQDECASACTHLIQRIPVMPYKKTVKKKIQIVLYLLLSCFALCHIKKKINHFLEPRFFQNFQRPEYEKGRETFK